MCWISPSDSKAGWSALPAAGIGAATSFGKNLRFFVGFTLAAPLVPLPAVDQPSSAPVPLAADAAWAELESLGLLEPKAPPNHATLSRREQSEWQERQALLLQEKGGAFLAAFPSDPRRWSVAWRMLYRAPAFIRSYGANYQTDPRDVVKDTAAAEAWKAKLGELEAALLAAPDLPAEVREGVDLRRVSKAFQEFRAAELKNAPADWTVVTRAVLAFAEKYPDSARLMASLRLSMYEYESRHRPAESLAAWQPFVRAAHGPLAAMAREKTAAFGAIAGEIDLRFTAVDGREVDLKQLRGKVVLVEFWATWCGPCIAELPNLKKIYADYHDLGFEVIGITLENARLLPEDTPAQTADKLARAKKVLVDFIARNDLPWPQFFDGRNHSAGGNPLAARFGVMSIPASFLIDQTGSVVALNPRGEKLGAEVRRRLQH